jgi:hypothetical protein
LETAEGVFWVTQRKEAKRRRRNPDLEVANCDLKISVFTRLIEIKYCNLKVEIIFDWGLKGLSREGSMTQFIAH